MHSIQIQVTEICYYELSFVQMHIRDDRIFSDMRSEIQEVTNKAFLILKNWKRTAEYE
jgi:hypothetical protein